MNIKNKAISANQSRALASGVGVTFGQTPRELLRLPERLITQGHRRVYYVLAVAHHRHETEI